MEPTNEKRGGARPGAGRPRKYQEPRAVIGGSVSQSTACLVKKYAESRGETVSDVVGQAVIDFIQRKEERLQRISELVAGGMSLTHAVQIVHRRTSV